ncbi:hypothetical protein [Proteus mirabilis]|uniref:hypothetical protein n=1 Tax=Proteus mirabilis TaxID=584 RepID=UPI001A20238C|nr:hypothetical protein [Proteus mirabilis]MDC5887676.1 hypothetical protein [Proteus mirabilis]MDC5905274.1 hypothetical protein [Proteus mirabilis]MDC5908817.1 hypothetical protein [Proteus mirabilis]MDC5922927.1 hypothetical protein [Proteus mirabilis]MDC5933455.1 hypothetical protein [Proteus mirabilis]
MNVNQLLSTQHTATDGRIYNDSKGRPVGLAGIVNRVKNTVDVPKQFPLQTPEDKIIMDMLFNKCFSHTEKYLQSKK